MDENLRFPHGLDTLQVERREHQIKILREDLADVKELSDKGMTTEDAKHESETSKLVEVALSEALQAASTRELHLELQWKAELETDLRKLRDTEVESRRLEKELKQLEEKLQRFPSRTALVQIFAVLDHWRCNRKALEKRQQFQQMQMDLLKSWDRRLEKQPQQLLTLDAECQKLRLEMAQGLRSTEEEAAQEEKELRERLARNQRRAHRAEGELSKYKAEVAAAKEGLEMACNGPLPPLERHMPRSALSEFSVAGALKALDQEGNDRFGLGPPRVGVVAASLYIASRLASKGDAETGFLKRNLMYASRCFLKKCRLKPPETWPNGIMTAVYGRVVSMLMVGTEVFVRATTDERISCSQLVDVSPPLPRGDLRQYLWPAPRHIELHADGQPIAGTNLQINPLRVDPCQLTFNFSPSGANVGSPDVLWTLWHWCWRLCSFDTSEETADEATCDASKGSCEASDVETRRLEVITLELGGASDEKPHLDMDESYQLTLDGKSSLRASSIHGLRRGMETLLQVLDALRDQSDAQRWHWTPGISADGKVVSLQIDDHPRFKWRGLMLDTARHFIPMQVMKSLLLGMASTKLNVLHWHLTDAMSFPLDLESLPKLAELGSFGPNKSYSKGMVQELIAFAANFSIRVVPEIDMPAHTASWIFAEPNAVSNCTHVLPDDPNEAKNVFKARDKLALDISSKRSVQVAKTILQEVAGLFPDEFLHIGGDEVDYRCWTTMPHIRKWMQKQGLGPVQALQRFFDEIFAEASLKVGDESGAEDRRGGIKRLVSVCDSDRAVQQGLLNDSFFENTCVFSDVLNQVDAKSRKELEESQGVDAIRKVLSSAKFQDMSALSCKDDSNMGAQKRDLGPGRRAGLVHFRLEAERKERVTKNRPLSDTFEGMLSMGDLNRLQQAWDKMDKDEDLRAIPELHCAVPEQNLERMKGTSKTRTEFL
ncbi:unnamed protein product [Cladocopium goreaui]|uniref:beta-N-acetylhexosaminidase n=1 Tax=Cladocopium goreaui TaxID=2562237 RepID=A0A9P1GKV1_9DINO|nr:unnamed protein product [Cladocopium goreaui]